ARRAFIAPAAGRAAMPSPFLLDDFLELRTFESFPGLRTVLRDLIAALGASGNRFVLTSRYASRALRLLRDAPSQFEIIHVAPLTAAEVRATLPGAHDDDHVGGIHDRAGAEDVVERQRDAPARAGQPLSDGRPAYARAIAETATTMTPRGDADPVSALAALLAPGGNLALVCRFCYELRLHRARGYGAL